jgi:hypothetical protein
MTLHSIPASIPSARGASLGMMLFALVIVVADSHFAMAIDQSSSWWFATEIAVGLVVLAPLVILAIRDQEVRDYLLTSLRVSRAGWFVIPVLAFVWVFVNGIAGYYGRELSREFFVSRAALLAGSGHEHAEARGFLIWVWVYEGVFAGLVEELATKTLVKLCLPQRLKSGVFFVLASSALFTAIHVGFSPGGLIIVALLFALPTAIYFDRTNKVGVLILFHAVYDLIVGTRGLFF